MSEKIFYTEEYKKYIKSQDNCDSLTLFMFLFIIKTNIWKGE